MSRQLLLRISTSCDSPAGPGPSTHVCVMCVANRRVSVCSKHNHVVGEFWSLTFDVTRRSNLGTVCPTKIGQIPKIDLREILERP